MRACELGRRTKGDSVDMNALFSKTVPLFYDVRRPTDLAFARHAEDCMRVEKNAYAQTLKSSRRIGEFVLASFKISSPKSVFAQANQARVKSFGLSCWKDSCMKYFPPVVLRRV